MGWQCDSEVSGLLSTALIWPWVGDVMWLLQINCRNLHMLSLLFRFQWHVKRTDSKRLAVHPECGVILPNESQVRYYVIVSACHITKRFILLSGWHRH